MICENCERSVFCPTWGEYRCPIYGNLAHIATTFICDDYREVAVKEEKPCHCETCMEREDDEE